MTSNSSSSVSGLSLSPVVADFNVVVRVVSEARAF